MTRSAGWLIGAGFAFVPLFPAFITLTGVSAPGVSLLSRPAAWSLFGLSALLDALLLWAVLQPPRRAAPTLVPLLCWLLAAVLSAAMGFAPLAGLVFLAIYAMSVVWHVGVLRYAGEPAAAAVIFWCLAFSAAAASTTAIVMEALRSPADLYAVGHGRAIGTFVLPGELAGYLIVVLPLMFALSREGASRALRWAAGGALTAGLAAFVLTFSRTGWIGLAAAGACYAVWSGAVRRRYAPLIVAGAVLAVLALFNVHHNPAENYTRLSIWQAALEMIRRFPLTGVGPFDFARVYPMVRVPGGDAQAFHAHNVVLTIFAETGIAGVSAMVWVWWRFAVLLRERLAHAAPANAALALAIAAGLAGTWVQGLIDTVSVVIFGLWLPVMALALAVAGSGQTKEQK
ncbi:MAG: O-antigen ligase family protein [Candidatus Baltobacteraceae bacterium]